MKARPSTDYPWRKLYHDRYLARVGMLSLPDQGGYAHMRALAGQSGNSGTMRIGGVAHATRKQVEQYLGMLLRDIRRGRGMVKRLLDAGLWEADRRDVIHDVLWQEDNAETPEARRKRLKREQEAALDARGAPAPSPPAPVSGSGPVSGPDCPADTHADIPADSPPDSPVDNPEDSPRQDEEDTGDRRPKKRDIRPPDPGALRAPNAGGEGAGAKTPRRSGPDRPWDPRRIDVHDRSLDAVDIALMLTGKAGAWETNVRRKQLRELGEPAFRDALAELKAMVVAGDVKTTPAKCLTGILNRMKRERGGTP